MVKKEYVGLLEMDKDDDNIFSVGNYLEILFELLSAFLKAANNNCMNALILVILLKLCNWTEKL